MAMRTLQSLTEMVIGMVSMLNQGESLEHVDNVSLFALWAAVDDELTRRAEPEAVPLESILPPDNPDPEIGEEDEEDGFGFIHNPDEDLVLSSLRNYGGL